MTADISIFAYLWGDTHNRFVAGWVEAIQALKIQPADVVVATDRRNPADLSGVPYRIMELDFWLGDDSPNVDSLNAIVASCSTRWIGICDIDDRLLPDAFAHLEDAEGYDVCANTIRFKSNGSWLPSMPERFHAEPERNHVMVNSYFTKEIFDRVGGFPKEAYFTDWGLWWKFHKHNARWFRSPGIQTLYDDIPHNHKTTSNLVPDAVERQVAWIRAYEPAKFGE